MTKRGRKPNKVRLLPCDYMRTQGWTRILKLIVMPGTSLAHPNQHKFCRLLEERYRIVIQPSQWRNWWEGIQIPQRKTIEKFENNRSLLSTTSWLRQFPDGNPFHRHFVAIDALVDAYSTDPTIRQRGLDAAYQVINALDYWWAPKEFPGHTSYIMKVSQSEYMYDSEVDPFAHKWEQGMSGYKDKELLLTLTRIYNPFDSTSVAQFLLVLGLFGLQSEKLLRHWVLDFVSVSYALYAMVLVKDLIPPMSEPTDAGKIAQVSLEFFEHEGINVNNLIHQSRRYPFTFKPDITQVCQLLINTHASYANQINELGFKVSDIKNLVQAAAFSDARIKETRRMVDDAAKVLLGKNYVPMEK